MTTVLKIFLLVHLMLPAVPALAALNQPPAECAMALDSNAQLLRALLQMAVEEKLLTLKQVKKCKTAEDLVKIVAAQPNEISTIALAESLIDVVKNFRSEDPLNFVPTLNAIVADLDSAAKQVFEAHTDTRSFLDPHLIKSKDLLPEGLVPYSYYLDPNGNPYIIGVPRPTNRRPIGGSMEFREDHSKIRPVYLFTFNERTKIFDDIKGLSLETFAPGASGLTQLFGQHYDGGTLDSVTIDLKDGKLLGKSIISNQIKSHYYGKKSFSEDEHGNLVRYHFETLKDGFIEIQLYQGFENVKIGNPIQIKIADKEFETKQFNYPYLAYSSKKGEFAILNLKTGVSTPIEFQVSTENASIVEWIPGPVGKDFRFAIQVDTHLTLYQASPNGEFIPTVVPISFTKAPKGLVHSDQPSLARILGWGPYGHAVIAHPQLGYKVVFFNGKSHTVSMLYSDESAFPVLGPVAFNSESTNPLLAYFDEKSQLNILHVDSGNLLTIPQDKIIDGDVSGSMIFTGEGDHLKLHLLTTMGDYREYQLYRFSNNNRAEATP